MHRRKHAQVGKNSLCYINTANLLDVCRLEESWIHTVHFENKAASKTPHRKCSQGKFWCQTDLALSLVLPLVWNLELGDHLELHSPYLLTGGHDHSYFQGWMLSKSAEGRQVLISESNPFTGIV